MKVDHMMDAAQTNNRAAILGALACNHGVDSPYYEQWQARIENAWNAQSRGNHERMIEMINEANRYSGNVCLSFPRPPVRFAA